MDIENSVIIQIKENSWLVSITDLIHFSITEISQEIFTFELSESLFMEKKVLFSSKPVSDFEKSLNEIFDLVYFLLNKDNRVFDYLELEEIRKKIIIYFGQNYPEKLGKELSISENLLVESFKCFEKDDFQTAIKYLEEAIQYDKWNVDINLLLLSSYIKKNDSENSENLLFEIYMGLKENKMILEPIQQEKYEELKTAQRKI